MANQNVKHEETGSCIGCVFFVPLFGDWHLGDCIAQGRTFDGVFIIDRIANARASWGHCGPGRRNYVPKKAA